MTHDAAWLATLTVLLSAAAACTTSAPAPVPANPVAVDVASDPLRAAVTFRGKSVGEAPVVVNVANLEEVLDIGARYEDQVPIETRVRILSPERVQIAFRFSSEPSKLAKALGLVRIIVFDYSDTATFPTDGWELQPSVLPMLEHQARLLNDHFAALDVFVCGHTDSTGSQAHNLELSLKRAQSVADFLVSNGVARSRLRVQGLAADYPVESNATPAGRGLNRRTELVLPQ